MYNVYNIYILYIKDDNDVVLASFNILYIHKCTMLQKSFYFQYVVKLITIRNLKSHSF